MTSAAEAAENPKLQIPKPREAPNPKLQLRQRQGRAVTWNLLFGFFWDWDLGFGIFYGVAAGETAGAGEPKLNCTGGGRSAPGVAEKNGRGGNPNIPAIKFVGKLFTAVL